MRKIALVAVLSMGAASLYAQEESLKPTLGFKVGIPVTDMFSTTTSGNGSSFSWHQPRYEFGASAEFHLPFEHLRFEVDGLYKRAGFDSFTASPLLGTSGNGWFPTSFNQWEIPGLFKYNFALGHYRPFVDLGASYRHISTLRQTNYLVGAPFATITDNSFALRNRNSFGGVVGFGLTFKKGPFELTPEARYTRWANEAFQYGGLRTNLDQGDVLLGIGF